MNQDGQVTSSELHAYIQGTVAPIAKGSQTAQTSQVGAGDFVFDVGKSKPSTSGPSTVATRSGGVQVSHFADYVWKRGAMHGVAPLTEEQIQHRQTHYRFEQVQGRVQTVTHVNSSGWPQMNQEGVVRWEHRYRDGGAGDIAELILFDQADQVVYALSYRDQAQRADLRDRNGNPTKTWQVSYHFQKNTEQVGPDVFGKGLAYDDRGFLAQEWYLSNDNLDQVRRLASDNTWGWGFTRNEAGQFTEKWPIDLADFVLD